MFYRLIILLSFSWSIMAQYINSQSTPDFQSMIQPVPLKAKFADDNYYIWGGSLIKDDKGVFHLYYSRWEKKCGFGGWVTHSEVAHATADSPFGPFTHKEVALPIRGHSYWDGMSTHNPTIRKFGSTYYLYYTGNTGDGKCTETLNFTHRNNQRIGVAISNDPNGPWKRLDSPLIDISTDTTAYDALMVSNPSVTMRPDGTYLLIYKAVAREKPLPFGGPVIHLAATSDSPTGPFIKQMNPIFTFEDAAFPAEDPYIWYQEGTYYAIVKDMKGYFTNAGRSLALFESKDGFSWALSKNKLVSDLTVNWEDGTKQQMSHLERPQLYFENGKPVVLLVAADIEEKGIIKESYNIQIPLTPSILNENKKQSSENIRTGELVTSYKIPYINDHTVIYNKEDKKWHMFGIIEGEKHFIHLTADSLTQSPWIRHNDFFVGSGNKEIWAPHIIYHNKLYYMFYTMINEPREIRYAISKDLYNWNHPSDKPILASSNIYTNDQKNKDPMVFRDDVNNQWIMYYSMMKDKKHWVVGYSTSKNLTEWTKPEICFDENTTSPGVESPFVVKRGDYYYLFLSARPWPQGGQDIFKSNSPYSWKSDQFVKRIEPWHAAEIVSDLNNKWYITRSSGRELKDFCIARLYWNDNQ